MPLVLTLALRNLFHDRLRLVATLIGIVFSIVLVTVQMGLYLGFGRMVTVALGRVEDLAAEGAVAVDRAYFDRLGVSKIGESAEIRQQAVKVVAITEGVRSFTTTPYIFTNLDSARTYSGLPPDKASYFLVRLRSGASLEAVRGQLLSMIPKVEVLTSAQFAERSRTFWLFSTGAGTALFAGALLGVIVGAAIVAQTLYASTKEHINEFATLRAIGSSRGYIYRVIVFQALLSGVIGFGIAAGVGYLVVRLTAGTALPIVLTPTLMAALFPLTLVMCVAAGFAAIVQIMRVDPASAFTR